MFRMKSNLKSLGIGQKLALGVVFFPLIVASLPLLVFLLYRGLKEAKKIEADFRESIERQREPETIRVEGRIVDIEPNDSQKLHQKP